MASLLILAEGRCRSGPQRERARPPPSPGAEVGVRSPVRQSVGLSKLPGQTPWCHRRLSDDAATCGRRSRSRRQAPAAPAARRVGASPAGRRQRVLGGRHSARIHRCVSLTDGDGRPGGEASPWGPGSGSLRSPLVAWAPNRAVAAARRARAIALDV